MRAMEFKYRDKVNFITLNAMQPKNGKLDITLSMHCLYLLLSSSLIGIMVDAFKVDGIPHIAFLDPSNEVKTALVGAVPKQILDQEISSLVQVSSAD